jgi:hypothetical protein
MPPKRSIKFEIPIRIWLKILESVIEPIRPIWDCSPTKNSQGSNTKLRLCMPYSAKISSVYNVEHQIMYAEQN